MIIIENVKVYNIARAVYSARNPLNSWEKSDSDLENDVLGENDLKLAQKLVAAGTEHRKFLRQIFVSMDITAPLYWLKEFDTYKIGTTSNSCSTMHKIHDKKFTISDFSYEISDKFNDGEDYGKAYFMWGEIIGYLNELREKYIETNDKTYWYQMIQILPTSYNQRRTITMNYENVLNIINQRQNHKLNEWREFCKSIKCLPYIKSFIKSVDNM